MPRYAKANQTVDSLKKKIESFENGVYEILNEEDATPKVLKDLSKIDVDIENAGLIDDFDMPGAESLPQYEMLGDFPVAWCGCGGDWQCPLIFVLYIGDNGGLRAYIPSKGNVYDHKHKCAYDGNCKDAFDVNLLREDVKNRIQTKEEIEPASLYDKETLKSLDGYIWNGDEEDQDPDMWFTSVVWGNFLSYVEKNFKLADEIDETNSCEDYDDCYTFMNSEDHWMYIIVSKGSKDEDIPPALFIHNEKGELVFEQRFKDGKAFAEYLNKNKDQVGKLLETISNSF